jgi:hypothetical protein
MSYTKSDFYNPDVKIEYLNYLGGGIDDKSLESYCRLFAVLKKHEENFNNDLCNFDYDSLKSMLPFILGKSLNSKRANISMLTKYIDWCITHQKSERIDNPLIHIDATDLSNKVKVRQQMVSSQEYLNKILDVVLENNPLDDMLRIGCILLFEGFNEVEMVEAEDKDVDFINNILYNKEHTKSIHISEELKRVLKNTIGVTEFELPSSNGKVRTLRFINNNKLYRRIEYAKTVDEAEGKISAFRSNLSGLRKKYYDITYQSISLSPQNLIDSGIFYRLYQREKNGAILTNEDFAYNVNDDLDATWKRDKVNINKRLYNDWKDAFDLK